jgi:hypothetical protein
VRIALISDFHLDLRPLLAHHGIADLFDAWVFSFEQGIQKPDPRMFTLALDALEVRPEHALMVGDRASRWRRGGGGDRNADPPASTGAARAPRPRDRHQACGLTAGAFKAN